MISFKPRVGKVQIGQTSGGFGVIIPKLKLHAVVVQEYVVITSTYQPFKKTHHLLEPKIGQIKEDPLGAIDNGNH